MTDESEMPGTLTANGLTWERYVYNDDTRYKWYRALTDEEVREQSRGLWDSLEDVDAEMASPPDYPIVEVELYHEPGGAYEVAAARTEVESLGPMMRNGIGGKFRVETDDREEAIAAVREFVRKLS